MRRARMLLILGVFVAILPFLGFPHSWKEILTTLSGITLICASYMLYKEARKKEIKKEETFDNFSENTFAPEEKTEEI